MDVSALKDVAIHYNAGDTNGESAGGGDLSIKLPALSAVMVSYSR